MRTYPLVFLVLALVLPFLPANASEPAVRPDVIFIMGDDHPWPAYGFMKTIEDGGSFATPTQHPDLPAIDTPNLDRLAARGAVFPIGAAGETACVASYHSALTGLYPKDFDRPGKGPKWQIPAYLAEAGYISYGYGKLWTSMEFAGFTEGGVRDWDLPRTTLDPLWDFIDARDPNGPPWFLWYGPRLPHPGYRYSEQFRYLFPKQMFPKRRSKAQKHYANIMLLDQWVGELLDGLEARGLDGRTLIVYMSDNGTLLRKSKRKYGENGFRTPILVSWPGVIPPGLVLPQMVHAIDILPTIAGYAGAALPSALEGQSMRPYFENPGLPGREFLLNSRAGRGFLRTREGLRFHLVHGRTVRLYDLTVDPDERHNLARDPQYADRIAAWTQVLRDFLDR